MSDEKKNRRVEASDDGNPDESAREMWPEAERYMMHTVGGHCVTRAVLVDVLNSLPTDEGSNEDDPEKVM